MADSVTQLLNKRGHVNNKLKSFKIPSTDDLQLILLMTCAKVAETAVSVTSSPVITELRLD